MIDGIGWNEMGWNGTSTSFSLYFIKNNAILYVYHLLYITHCFKGSINIKYFKSRNSAIK